MKDHSNMYDIIDTGKYCPLIAITTSISQIRTSCAYYYLDEETSDTECTSYGARKRYNDNRSNDNKKDGPVNYFFNDFSGSDDEKPDHKVKRKRQSLNIPNYKELIKM